MQTKQKPPITIKPDAMPLLKRKHMPEIRDMVLEQIISVAEERDIHIHQIVIHPYYAGEYMGEYQDKTIFSVFIPADDDTAMSYWSSIGDALTKAEKDLSKPAYDLFNDFVASVFVEWLPHDSFYKAIKDSNELISEW